MDGVLDFDKTGTGAHQAKRPQPVTFWLDQFVAACECDNRTTALSFVARHPEIAADEHLVAALGYEEFCRRLQAGECVDEQAFYAQFPDGGRLVKHHVITHHYLRQHPSLLPSLQALPNGTIAGPRPARIKWPAPGETVGGFELVEVIGRGGFARVYLAEELALGRRRVVVKMARGGAREANTLGKLQHPNIVPVHSVSFDAGRRLTLICMPYLGRVTLHDVVRRLIGSGRIPRLGRELLSLIDEATGAPAEEPADARIANASYVDAVVHLWLQMAEALDYTNLLRIYHRDLKPSNVLIAGGKPMLLDFNLSHDDKSSVSRLAGTLRYMAPELVRLLADDEREAEEIDPRSDIYSLAVMVYELLSGEHPFGELTHRGANAAAARELFARQQGPPRPLRERNADVDPGLVNLLERCLSFDPDGRPGTASLVADELRDLVSRPRRIWGWVCRHRRTVAAAFIAIGAGAAAGGYALAKLPPSAERQFLAALEARQQGDLPGALLRLDAAETKGYDAREVGGLRGELHFQLAKQAFLSGHLVAARDHCGAALDAGETDWQTYMLRARAQFGLGEFNLALADAKKAEDKHPCNEIEVLRGDCFCGLAQWDAAIRAYRFATERGFWSAGLSNNLAFALTKSGQREEAIEWLERALAADRLLGAAYYQRASVLAALADGAQQPMPVQAMTDVERASELCPQNGRVCLAAARTFGTAHVQTGNSQYAEQAVSFLFYALRLGMSPEEIRASGVPTQIIERATALPGYQLAVERGASAERRPPPGLVDSLAGISFE